MIRAGRTIAAIVLACLVAGDPAVASTWDQALVTSLIDQGRDAEAIALCDAAIASVDSRRVLSISNAASLRARSSAAAASA